MMMPPNSMGTKVILTKAWIQAAALLDIRLRGNDSRINHYRLTREGGYPEGGISSFAECR